MYNNEGVSHRITVGITPQARRATHALGAEVGDESVDRWLRFCCRPVRGFGVVFTQDHRLTPVATCCLPIRG